jgi:hypothetical protein
MLTPHAGARFIWWGILINLLKAMAALQTVNYSKLALTRYQLLRQIKSGSE